jgi:Tfp pilus assembly protein PilV
MKQKPNPKQKGLGLLEVLAAVALLALGVSSIFGIIGTAATWNQQASMSTKAINFAAGVLETYRSRPDQIRVMPETAVDELDLDLEPPSGFAATVAIEEYDPNLDLYLVKVRVSWSESGESQGESLYAVWQGS